MRALLGASLGLCVSLAACGGNSVSDDQPDGSVGGSTGGLGGGITGGSGGLGGAVTGGAGGLGGVAGGAGQAGAPCVTSTPGAYPLCETPAGAACDSPGYFCVLDTACSGGYVSDLMECKADASGATTWQLPPYCCDKPYNVCALTDITCLNGSMVYANGDSPTQGCALDRPAVGDACTPGADGAPTCGYPCPTGSGWSVATCESVGKQQAFLFDGACAGDCSQELAALGDFVEQSSKCNTTSDCKILYTGCAPIAEHCSGAVYLNTFADPGQWNALTQAYDSCHAGGGVGCAVCDGLPPLPACKDGICAPGP